MEPGKEEKLEQLEKILHSRSLHDAETLKAFLRYVVLKSLDQQDVQLKEYVIATEVLGRHSDYDPNVDSAVRVQARRLRAKLQDYYATEGKDDKVLIDLPKGRYTPTVTYNQPEESPINGATKAGPFPEAATVAPASVASPATDVTSQSFLKPLVIGLVLLSSLLGLLAVNYYSEAKRLKVSSPPPDGHGRMQTASPLWSQLLPSSEPILIAYSNTLFEMGADDRLKYVKPMPPPPDSSSSTNSPDEVRSVNQTALTEATPTSPQARIVDYYTGVGEVMGVSSLSLFLSKAEQQFRVKRSLLLNWDDLKAGNAVILGSPLENLFLRQLPQRQTFVFVPNKENRSLSIVDLKPRAGEPASYTAKIDRTKNEGPTTVSVLEDYALVSVLKGLGDSNKLLILAGITTYGTQAAAEYVTKPEHIADLTAHLNSSPTGGAPIFPAYYQILLRVRINGGVPVQISYVKHHVLE